MSKRPFTANLGYTRVPCCPEGARRDVVQALAVCDDVTTPLNESASWVYMHTPGRTHSHSRSPR